MIEDPHGDDWDSSETYADDTDLYADGTETDGGAYTDDTRSGGMAASAGDGAGDTPQNGSGNAGALDEEYLTAVATLLDRIKTDTGASNIYIEKKVSDARKGYVLKPAQPEPRHLTDTMTEEELLAFNDGSKLSSGVMNDDASGEYLKGFAPVLDTHSAEPVGVVVVEFLMADAMSLMAGVSRIITGSFVVIFLLITFVVYRLLASRAKYLFTDYLTTLSNRRYFERQLGSMIGRARETGQPLSLMMIDIDRFKNINDTLGHVTGDLVLKAVSMTLQRCTRRSDTCCRVGGDEFAMILPRATGEQAAAIAERIRQEIVSLNINVSGHEFSVTLSIGIAEFGPGMTAVSLVERADQTLYVSKNGGKNRTSVYGWA